MSKILETIFTIIFISMLIPCTFLLWWFVVKIILSLFWEDKNHD